MSNETIDINKILANTPSPADIKATISDLKSLNLKEHDFGEIKEMVCPLVQCGSFEVPLSKGTKIFRGRCIDPRDVLKNVSQISYPPFKNVLKYNRVSSSNRPWNFHNKLFTCCIVYQFNLRFFI